MIQALEILMYEVSNTFLTPILLLVIALFMYSIFETGVFIAQYFKRKKTKVNYDVFISSKIKNTISGFPLMNYVIKNGFSSNEDIEVYAHKKLQTSSIITRISPMLGLVATMIPMGPALKALSNGNIQGISENLIVAFAAVIFSLITASITYWITTVRRGWYAHELKDILEMNKD